MGKVRDLGTESCRNMERVGANKKSNEDMTVSGRGRDMSNRPWGGSRTAGNMRHGPGFPCMEFGEDEERTRYPLYERDYD